MEPQGYEHIILIESVPRQILEMSVQIKHSIWIRILQSVLRSNVFRGMCALTPEMKATKQFDISLACADQVKIQHEFRSVV